MADTAQNPTINTAPSTPPILSGIIDIAELFNLEETLRTKAPILTLPPLVPLKIELSDGRIGTANSALARKKGYYIIPYLQKFYYFKIGDIVPNGKHLFKIVGKQPPLFREGMVVIDKDVFYVTLEDLRRSLIRKSRKLKLKRGSLTYEDFITGNAFLENTQAEPTTDSNENPRVETVKGAGVKVSASARASGPENTSEVSNNPLADLFGKTRNKGLTATGKKAKLDESEIIDMAFEEQIGALLNNVSQEEGSSWEEWEVTEAP